MSKKINVEVVRKDYIVDVVSKDESNTNYTVAYTTNGMPRLVGKGKGNFGIRLTENPNADASIRVIVIEEDDPELAYLVKARLFKLFERISLDGWGYPIGYADATRVYKALVRERDVIKEDLRLKELQVRSEMDDGRLAYFLKKKDEVLKRVEVAPFDMRLQPWTPDNVESLRQDIIKEVAYDLAQERTPNVQLDAFVQRVISKMAEERLVELNRAKAQEDKAKALAKNKDIDDYFNGLLK